MKYRLPMLEERSVQDARGIRSSIAEDFERDLLTKGPTSCHKGCSHCCSNPVVVSILEGISVFRWLVEHRHWSTALKAKFEAHHAQVYGLALTVWLISETPCPLLDPNTQTCSAYDARPLACRLTFSKGDAYLCHPHRVVEAHQVVDRRQPIEQALRQENLILKRHKLRSVLLPLSTAVLLGEAISKGEFSLQEYPHRVLQIEIERG